MEVRIPCPCPRPEMSPELRHPDGDTVYLRDVLDFHQATTITKAVQFIDNDDEKSRAAEVLATLSEYYVLMGVERWTLRDASNKPVEVTRSAIRQFLLNHPTTASLVAEAGDLLYSEAILLPLLARVSNSSPPSQTDTPMSPKPRGSPPKSRKPSRRSSITTIPTDATETTSGSLVGDSSFSQSSESAA